VRAAVPPQQQLSVFNINEGLKLNAHTLLYVPLAALRLFFPIFAYMAMMRAALSSLWRYFYCISRVIPAGSMRRFASQIGNIYVLCETK